MARAMHGLAAAQPDLTPTRVDPTPVVKWCASSFNSQQQPLALLFLADGAATDGQHRGVVPPAAQMWLSLFRRMVHNRKAPA